MTPGRSAASRSLQVAPEQGALLTLLTRLTGARRAIEIGTFTGYSALCIALGLPDDGELVCCDVSDEWTKVGRPHWEKAGVAHKIDLRIAPATATLAALAGARDYDLAFIDADKTGYDAYYEALLGLIRPGGLILVDNVLWGGSVIDSENQSDDTCAIRAFNDKVADDTRVDCVMTAISDGLTLLRVHELRPRGRGAGAPGASSGHAAAARARVARAQSAAPRSQRAVHFAT